MFGVRKACRELAEWCHETQQENDRLKAENAKLVDVLHEVEEEAVLAFNSLRQDCETITDSSQHFFEKWWHAECEVDRLKAENAKLRELASKLGILADSGLMALDDKEFASIIDNAKELGVDWWTSSSACSASTSTSSSATSTATRLTT